MKAKVIGTEGKRPIDATPEKALELSELLSLSDIGKMWGITRQRVWQLIQKAKKKASIKRGANEG